MFNKYIINKNDDFNIGTWEISSLFPRCIIPFTFVRYITNGFYQHIKRIHFKTIKGSLKFECSSFIYTSHLGFTIKQEDDEIIFTNNESNQHSHRTVQVRVLDWDIYTLETRSYICNISLYCAFKEDPNISPNLNSSVLLLWVDNFWEQSILFPNIDV